VRGKFQIYAAVFIYFLVGVALGFPPRHVATACLVGLPLCLLVNRISERASSRTRFWLSVLLGAALVVALIFGSP
jgi:hypothetical protein